MWLRVRNLQQQNKHYTEKCGRNCYGNYLTSFVEGKTIFTELLTYQRIRDEVRPKGGLILTLEINVLIRLLS